MPPIPQLNPNMMQQAGMANPFAPPSPNAMLPPSKIDPVSGLPVPANTPPPSAAALGLGFQDFAAQQANNLKVQQAMTSQFQPLQPNAGMASANPPPLPPMASAAPPGGFQQQTNATRAAVNAQPSPDAAAPLSLPSSPSPIMASSAPPVQSQTAADMQRLQDLQTQGAGLNKIQNPWLRGLARAGDIAGTILAPGVASAIPGTTVHNWTLQNMQQGRVAQDQAAQQAEAQLADTQSQTQQRNAAAAKLEAQSEAYAPVTLTPEQANAIGYPDLAGQSMDPRHVATLMAGKQKTGSAETIATGKNQTAQQIADAKDKRIQGIADAANKTKLLLQDKKDATSTANTSARIAAKGTPGAPGAAAGKVPADVTKRAALAGNVIENANAITAILKDHPEIVGPAGGRYSNVQQMIGSDDPNIQELGVRMHNVALASNGAHGLRSAEAVAQTEKELFNNFKTGPHGIAGGLKGLTDSVQTFLQDESNFQTSGRRTGNPMAPPAQGGPKVGDVITLKDGTKVTVKVVHSDGSFD